MNTRSILLSVTGALALLAVTATGAQDQAQDAVDSQQQVQEAIDTQLATQQASVEVQQRINDLDDQTREMLNEYRLTMSQVSP